MSTVLVIIEQQLLSAAIMSLLLAESNVELLGYSLQTTVELLEITRQLQPDLIIIDQAVAGTETMQTLLCSPREYHSMNLLVVHLENNQVGIYQQSTAYIEHPDDLLTLVRSLCQKD
ncbi:MAG: hypothetical protein R2867_08070 [Caldilineaceae bacterium]